MTHGTILGWLLIGLVTGVGAKLLWRDSGIAVTVLIGIAGALLAGFVAQITGHAPTEEWPGLVAPTVGSVALLALYRWVLSRRV